MSPFRPRTTVFPVPRNGFAGRQFPCGLLYRRSFADSASTAGDIVRKSGRVGIYFLETGANQRPSKVLYDRAGSSISLARPGDFDWDKIFDGASWFHVTGITPALSPDCAELSIEAAKTAQEKGLTVSCDYNFRKKLWKYGKSAPEVMRELAQFVDVGIATKRTARRAWASRSAASTWSWANSTWSVTGCFRRRCWRRFRT